MSAKLERRLAQAEAALRKVLPKGWRHFIKVTGGSEYFENTREAGYSYQSAMVGMDGKAPEGAKLFTAADLQQLEREGWDVFTIQYVDYSQDNQQGHKLW